MMIKLLLFLIAYTCATPIVPKAEPQDYRLPESAVEVSKYEIELRLADDLFDTNQFEGTVSIWFRNLKNTNEIKLHANRINFVETRLFVISAEQEEEVETAVELEDENFLSDNDTDILTIISSSQLPADTNYRISFTYTAVLRTDEMYGFYKSSYIARDGQIRYLGTTQFQATHARKVFPCFDEPEYKAIFDIKIRHPKELLPLALGNTRGTSADDQDDTNFLITTFETTPKMSTYLIAFIVSDFTCTNSSGDIPHSVCSREEAAPNRQVAVDFGPQLIEVMENITKIPYLDSGIGKMHQVAIPDFSAGAMENWGLLTYRETGLLYDPNESSNSYKQSIQNVISHEIAHMWFGNLVTCKWWSNTFLNEGFARLYQYFATAAVEKDWQLDKQFVTAQVQPMLVNDAQPSAAALSSEAYTQAQVSGRFASVSYNKGASIFRMLQHVIGEENFNEGLQKYLSDNQFGATVPEDLWAGIEPSIPSGTLPDGTTLSQVMDSWINRAGYPLLHVQNNGGSITVTQKRFLLSGTPEESDVWYVPIAYTLSTDQNKFEDTSARAWLLPTEELVIDAVPESPAWIILNNQQIGYYRVHYEDDLLQRIETALNSENFGDIHELNRAHLVDDIYNLAKIDVYKYARVFQLLSFLRNETSYFTWNSAFTAFSNMLSRTGDEKIRDALSALILELLETVYSSVPFDQRNDEDQIYTFNRVQVITWACRLNLQDCVDKAVNAFKSYAETKITPDKNLKSVIYCNGLRHSTNIREDWDFLWSEYSSTKLATEQATILSALGCATDQEVLNDFLSKSITVGSGIRQQDASSVFSSVYTQNPGGVDIAYEFLIANWRAISSYYGSMNALNNLFSGLAARFTKEEQVLRLEELLANPEDDFPETVATAAANALKNAQANLALTAEFEQQLTEYFELDSGEDGDESGGYRLPEGAVEVSKYEIELRLADDLFDTNQFEGIVSIWFRNLKNTNEIKLHANRIGFVETQLFAISLNEQQQEVETAVQLTEQNFLSDNDTDILTVISSSQLPANTNYKLYFTYSAVLRTDEMYGFYKSYYIAPDGQNRYLGTTQFQPTNARKAFPCFDEPEYKAVFNIKIRHPKELLPLALGNTGGTVVDDQDDTNFLITTFETTPKMSTYLIAFIVSDFTCTNSSGDIPHSVCSRAEAAPNRQVAVDFGPQLIEVMENITKIPYLDSGIGKMHQVAIPDFSAGAMENWGLLTYRETMLLYDPNESANSYKQSIQNVISHEIAHMWFGNLVTCKWWSNTFLNEGFARLYQYFATAAVEKDWQLDKQFVTAQVQPMLVNDAQPSAAALSSEAYTQAQVSGRFASVSYNKGASIFRMLQHVMGEENFNKGLQKYLSDNQFGATVPEDLWAGIEPSIPSGTLPDSTTLSQVMDSWINRAGYPLLHVQNNGGSITVTQKRFLLSGTPEESDVWYVPIAYTLSTDQNKFEDTSARAWLLPTEGLTINTILEDAAWIILNNQQIGYYRVHYEDDLLQRIEAALNSDNFGDINEINRAHLVDDIYNLAKIDVYKYARVFQLFKFLRNETSYFTWNSALTAFSNMLSRTGDEKIRDALSALILELLETVYNSVPFDQPKDEDQIYTFNRVQAITWACRLNLQDCVDKAVGAFRNYADTNIKPDKNLKSVIYCNGLRHSTNIREDWDFLWNEYSSTKLATEQATILSALGCATDQEVLNDFLSKSITVGSGIRQQDASSVFSSVYTQNPGGVDIAYEFLIANWRAISSYYGSMNALNNLFTGLAARFTKEEQVQRLEDFLSNPEDDFPETVATAAANALKNAQANLALTAEFEQQLKEYFELEDGDESGGYRLPEGAVEVSKYEIELRLADDIFDTNQFEGIVSIWFRNLKNTNEIKLHANRIGFVETQLFAISLNEQQQEVETAVQLTEQNFLSDNDTDILTVISSSQLPANTNYRLYFTYSAVLRTDEMYGFYKSYYIAPDGQNRYLGTTQFQPTNARKAFPCFDEPEYKAVFDIKIRHPKELLPLALGNTRGTSADDQDDTNFLITTFETTPKMSTYLIAFVVSDFTCTNSSGDIPHSVCSRVEAAPNRQVAVDFGPQLIEVMENITKIPYLDSGIGKMHQVAIPDFSAGAMENWGLLTYRETALLYDPNESSNSYKQSIQNVITHEIAHMWFGNLVTCKWWSNTFLNEGFATLYQYFATAAVEKDWQLDKQFVTAQVQPMLVNDAQPSAAALSSEVYTQAQVSGRFASVSYNKGASVFRMLQHVMGEENFNEGIQKYLADNKFGATVPEDLWAGIEPSIPSGTLPDGTTLSQVMDSWINRAGYPLLHVQNNGGTITVTQKRFLLSGTPEENDSWFVPIAYTLYNDTNKFEDTSVRAWLLPTEELVINAVLEGPAWIILNNQQIGYYRVHYDDDLLQSIETALNSDNFGNIHELNRAHLVDDIYNLAKIDVYKYARVFQWLSFLRNETSYFTWNSAFTAFSNMLSRTGDEKIRDALSALILELLETVYNNVQFEKPNDEDQIYTFNRVQVATWACRLNLPDCINKAVAAFKNYTDTTIKPDRNLKSVIYCNGLRHSTNIRRDWDFLWNEYSSTQLATEQATILSALGCATDPEVLNDFLNKSITVGSGIRQQDASSVFSSVYTQNPGGVDIAYDFLIANWRAISSYYGSMNALSNLFSGLAARFTKEEQVQRLADFLENPEDDFPETVATAAADALKNAQANLALTAEFEQQLKEYFELDSDGDGDGDGTDTADCLRIGFITILMSILMVFYQTWM